MTRRIRKAVFPVAGMGTRFLPATKTVPKEMMPIVDRPLIQYAVDEAVEAGCDTLVFVTNRYKHSVADYFDTSYELERKLEKAGKLEQLELIRNVLPKGVRAVFVTQSQPLGLGHAVLCARAVIGNEPFAVLLPDDLIQADPGAGALAQMADLAERTGGSVIAVEQVPEAMTSQYGIVDAGEFYRQWAPVHAIVEKPSAGTAPSSMAVVGRYILDSRIFDLLEDAAPGQGGEIQLTDAIARLITGQPVHAYRFAGTRYDCGTHLGLVSATIGFALTHPQLWRQTVDVIRGALEGAKGAKGAQDADGAVADAGALDTTSATATARALKVA